MKEKPKSGHPIIEFVRSCHRLAKRNKSVASFKAALIKVQLPYDDLANVASYLYRKGQIDSAWSMGKIDFFTNLERQRKVYLPSGPKAAGMKSAEMKVHRLGQVRDAIRKLRAEDMNLNLRPKRVYEILWKNQSKYFKDGKAPYKKRGLYDSVRAILAE